MHHCQRAACHSPPFWWTSTPVKRSMLRKVPSQLNLKESFNWAHAQGFVFWPLGQNRLRINSLSETPLRISFLMELSSQRFFASSKERPSSSLIFRMKSRLFSLYSCGTYAPAAEEAGCDFAAFGCDFAWDSHFLFLAGGSATAVSSDSAGTMFALYCLLMAKGLGSGGDDRVLRTSHCHQFIFQLWTICSDLQNQMYALYIWIWTMRYRPFIHIDLLIICSKDWKHVQKHVYSWTKMHGLRLPKCKVWVQVLFNSYSTCFNAFEKHTREAHVLEATPLPSSLPASRHQRLRSDPWISRPGNGMQVGWNTIHIYADMNSFPSYQCILLYMYKLLSHLYNPVHMQWIEIGMTPNYPSLSVLLACSLASFSCFTSSCNLASSLVLCAKSGRAPLFDCSAWYKQEII